MRTVGSTIVLKKDPFGILKNLPRSILIKLTFASKIHTIISSRLKKQNNLAILPKRIGSNSSSENPDLLTGRLTSVWYLSCATINSWMLRFPKIKRLLTIATRIAIGSGTLQESRSMGIQANGCRRPSTA